MKVKVLERFKDKHTGEIHKKDKVMEITEERYAEITEVEKEKKKKLVEKVAETEEPAEEAEEAKAKAKKKADK